MNYIPNTDADRAAMLATVGVESVAELFRDVPEKYRFPVLDLRRRFPRWKCCKNSTH